MIDALPNGSLGVVAPDQLIAELSGALTDAGINHGTATRTGLDAGVTLVPVSVVKGLELDGVVVVEPHADRDRSSSRACARCTSRSPAPPSGSPSSTRSRSRTAPLTGPAGDVRRASGGIRSSAVAGVVVDQVG